MVNSALPALPPSDTSGHVPAVASEVVVRELQNLQLLEGRGEFLELLQAAVVHRERLEPRELRQLARPLASQSSAAEVERR